jgi:hypothetical protein
MSDDTFARRHKTHIGATTQMAAARVAASTYATDPIDATSAGDATRSTRRMPREILRPWGSMRREAHPA